MRAPPSRDSVRAPPLRDNVCLLRNAMPSVGHFHYRASLTGRAPHGWAAAAGSQPQHPPRCCCCCRRRRRRTGLGCTGPERSAPPPPRWGARAGYARFFPAAAGSTQPLQSRRSLAARPWAGTATACAPAPQGFPLPSDSFLKLRSFILQMNNKLFALVTLCQSSSSSCLLTELLLEEKIQIFET